MTNYLKIFLSGFILSFSLGNVSQTTIKVDSFTIYYVPLEIQFYVPPTPEYIEKHGTKIQIKSNMLTDLYNKINENSKFIVSNEDMKSLRVKIQRDKDGKIIYITSDKHILSNGKRLTVDKLIVDSVLKEIKENIKQKK